MVHVTVGLWGWNSDLAPRSIASRQAAHEANSTFLLLLLQVFSLGRGFLGREPSLATSLHFLAQ